MVEDLRISEIHYDSPMTPNNAITEIHTGEIVEAEAILGANSLASASFHIHCAISILIYR